MFLLKQILPSAIMAMMVAVGVCGLALLWEKERERSVLGPLAVGIAYAIGHLFTVGRVSFPPADTTNWLPYLAVAAASLGAFCAVVTIKVPDDEATRYSAILDHNAFDIAARE